MNRKFCQVERLERIRLANDGSDGLAAISRLVVREHRLIGESRDHAIAIDARHIFRGENQRLCRR